jgi:hypothetical protein
MQADRASYLRRSRPGANSPRFARKTLTSFGQAKSPAGLRVVDSLS